ncbi:MAG: M48 family metalloprotease, partial [Myxococcota bacterium]
MTLTRAFSSRFPPPVWPVRIGFVRTLGLMLLLVVALPGCARNPVTGRPEPVLTTERGEIEQGNEAAKQVEKQIGLVDDPKLQAYIKQLGQRLAAHSPRKNIQYHFAVVEMVEPNAFALPGGHVYVSRGLLVLPNSEDALATIIGHEIGHVAARHAVRRQTASAPLIPLQIASAIGGAATAIVSPRLGRIVTDAGQLPGAFALAAYSRDQEQQADELGQQIAAAAGFNPQALGRFIRTLSLEEKLATNSPQRSSFWDSHPPSTQRAVDAEKYGRDLVPATGQSPPLGRRAFLRKLEGIVVGDGAAEGLFVGNEFLHPELKIGFELPTGWERVNTPRAVIAQQKDGRAQIVVELVGPGEDPMERALAFGREVVPLE